MFDLAIRLRRHFFQVITCTFYNIAFTIPVDLMLTWKLFGPNIRMKTSNYYKAKIEYHASSRGVSFCMLIMWFIDTQQHSQEVYILSHIVCHYSCFEEVCLLYLFSYSFLWSIYILFVFHILQHTYSTIYYKRSKRGI